MQQTGRELEFVEGIPSSPRRALRPALARWQQSALVLILCAVLAVLMTQPLMALRRSHLIESRDTMVHYWNGWWAKQSLREGPASFYHTDHLFHPEGVSLVYQNVAWLNVAAWLALQPLLGGLAAYNVTLVLFVALCGWAAFLLTRELTGSPSAGMVAAIVYQNWPARLTRLNFPNLVNTACIPLSLFFLIRTLRDKRWYDGLLTGVFVALTGYSRWQQLIPASIVIGIYLAFAALRQLSDTRLRTGDGSLRAIWQAHRRQIALLLLAGLVAASAFLPPALMLFREQRSNGISLVETGDGLAKGADLLAYLTPSDRHPLLRRWTDPLYDRYHPRTWDLVAYLGLVPLALSLLALWQETRPTLPWGTAALCLLLLGLGPVLRVNGETYPAIPTLYGLVDKVLPLSLIRVPARFNVFLALPVAVLTGYGSLVPLVRARRRVPWAPVVLSALIAVAILAEYLPGPIPMQPADLSPYYDQLAAEPGDVAVLNVPIAEQAAKVYMFAQTRHRHPMMQGHVSRLPDAARATIEGNPWLDALRRTDEMEPGFTDVGRQLNALARQDVGVILLHKPLVGADRIEHWKRYLLIQPVYEDHALVAFSTEPRAGQDFTLREELAPGLGPIRIITSTNCLNPGGMLAVDVGWGTLAPPGQDHGLELALVGNDRRVAEKERYSLSPDWPTGQWPADAVAWGYYTLPITATLPTGTYTLTMALSDPVTGQARGRTSSLGTVSVVQELCTYPTPPDFIETNALYGHDLRLLGYRVRRDGDHLRVVLAWRAERRMATDYKVFVHVFDPQTKRPVAQDDAPPHRGAYPTVYWAPGEVVEDRIPISLAGAPAGRYGVAVGIYDPTTMERATLRASDGIHADGRLELPGETIVIDAGDP